MWVRRLARRWARASVDGLHIFLAASMIAIWIAGWQGEMEAVKTAAYCGMAVLILVHLLHWGLASCGQFLDLYEETDRLPDRQIKRVCGGFLGFLMASLALFMAVLPNLDLTGIWGALKNGIGSVLRWLTSLLPEKGQEAAAGGYGETGSFSPPSLAGLEGEPSWLIRILETLIQAAMSLFLAVLLAYGLYCLFRKALRVFSVHDWDGDEKVFLAPETYSRRVRGNAGKKRALRGEDGGYSGKIRRLYRRRLKKAAENPGVLRPSATPAELEAAAGVAFPDGGLHDVYEKARYSREGAGREDWEKVRR